MLDRLKSEVFFQLRFILLASVSSQDVKNPTAKFSSICSKRNHKMESFCLLCYKSIGLSPENISKLANRNILSLHRFVKTLVGRNVANVLFANENNQIGICQSCVWVLEKFSDLSLELECIQMKMQWELKTLKQVLHQAALVPSRLNRLQEYFSTDEDSKMALEKHLGIRKKIYLKCKLLHYNILPVILKTRLVK